MHAWCRMSEPQEWICVYTYHAICKYSPVSLQSHPTDYAAQLLTLSLFFFLNIHLPPSKKSCNISLLCARKPLNNRWHHSTHPFMPHESRNKDNSIPRGLLANVLYTSVLRLLSYLLLSTRASSPPNSVLWGKVYNFS